MKNSSVFSAVALTRVTIAGVLANTTVTPLTISAVFIIVTRRETSGDSLLNGH